MNIFYLHAEPTVAAAMQHDKHVVKMVLETAQILSSVHARYRSPIVGYKPTHANHPSVLWAGDAVPHYQWLVRHGMALCKEYTHRYGRTHASEAVIARLSALPPGLHAPRWQSPPQCMPPEFQVAGDAVTAYRQYYLGAKVDNANWTRRARPDFLTTQGIIMATAKKTAPVAATKAPVAAPVAAKKAPAAKAAPAPAPVAEVVEAAVPRSRGPRGTTEDAVIHLLVDGNPKREGSKAAAVFSYYEEGMTIGQFADALAEAELGAEATPNLVYDAKHGNISIEGYEPPGGVAVKADKPAKAEKPAKVEKTPKRRKEDVAETAEADAAAQEEVID